MHQNITSNRATFIDAQVFFPDIADDWLKRKPIGIFLEEEKWEEILRDVLDKQLPLGYVWRRRRNGKKFLISNYHSYHWLKYNAM